MKPKISLPANEFLKILETCDAKIIKREKAFLQPLMYLIEGKDYYYYTSVPEELTLPTGREVITSKHISF